MFIAYKITNARTGKVYIGVTKRSLRERWADHREVAPFKRSKLYASMRKHGIANFCIEHVASARTIEDLFALERILIEQENSFHRGYNATLGGDGPSGLTHSVESREKMRRSQTGKKQSAETIAKRAAILKGRKGHIWTEQHRKNWRAAMAGKVIGGRRPSDAGLQQISEKNSGAGNGMFGRSHSPEARRKIADANKCAGDEYLRRIADAVRQAAAQGYSRPTELMNYWNGIGFKTRFGAQWTPSAMSYIARRLRTLPLDQARREIWPHWVRAYHQQFGK